MRNVLASLQWSIFILAGSIVTPLAVGAAFQLDQGEMVGLLQRTFFVIGMSCLLQGVFGHRLPILEGPAGLWWGVFLIFSTLVTTASEKGGVLQEIELGLMVSGLLFMALSLFGLVGKVRQLFTPAVTGTYLILLVFQLSGVMVKGLLGIGYLTSGIHLSVAALAVLTLLISVLLAYSSRAFLRNYSVLLGLLLGWFLFAGFGLIRSGGLDAKQWFAIPQLWAWGTPRIDPGILLSSITTSFLLLTNLVASIDLVEKAVNTPVQNRYNRSGFVMGINHLLAGLFSTIGCVPNSHSAGFILTTKITERLPFLLGSAVIIVIGFFPGIASFFAGIPTPVAYASVFLPFSNLLIVGLKEVGQAVTYEKSNLVIGFALMFGIGCMFVPPGLLTGLSPILVPVVSNGLIMGVLAAILLEQTLVKPIVKRSH
jgi:xanthine/uracil permease